jgi:hypothetical protein
MTPSTALAARAGACALDPVRAFAYALARDSSPPHLRFGSLRICAHTSGIWEPDESGPRAVVLNVPDASGEPCDLVAWLPSRPEAWWRRSGHAAILGARNVERADFFATPIVVHSTPERWLFACGRGVCVLDWAADLRFWLGGSAALVADSPILARRLDAALGRRTDFLQPTGYRHAD